MEGKIKNLLFSKVFWGLMFGIGLLFFIKDLFYIEDISLGKFYIFGIIMGLSVGFSSKPFGFRKIFYTALSGVIGICFIILMCLNNVWFSSVQQLLIFFTLGTIIAVTIGIIDRSLRKAFLGIIGSLVMAVIIQLVNETYVWLGGLAIAAVWFNYSLILPMLLSILLISLAIGVLVIFCIEIGDYFVKGYETKN